MCVYFKYSSKIKKRSLRDPLPAAACGTPGWLKVGRGNKYCLHAQTHTHLYFSHVSLITNQLWVWQSHTIQQGIKKEGGRSRQRGEEWKRKRGWGVKGFGKTQADCSGRRRVLSVTAACRRLRNMIRLRVSREREREVERERKVWLSATMWGEEGVTQPCSREAVRLLLKSPEELRSIRETDRKAQKSRHTQTYLRSLSWRQHKRARVFRMDMLLVVVGPAAAAAARSGLLPPSMIKL